MQKKTSPEKQHMEKLGSVSHNAEFIFKKLYFSEYFLNFLSTVKLLKLYLKEFAAQIRLFLFWCNLVKMFFEWLCHWNLFASKSNFLC